ncbi:hypothetical protein DFW101_2656 [Solidesulfovibrio carbinoliphilus subsp. oakridgensis]|uniref:Uncharacterized protein n=2 Tax=Desulfovibrionaceae TaxID=194924 RepID=G7Q9M0_9BACT|nr:hypothetical protein [Solidesulfovibrio carbinoliphilus]EHJ48660.1 hypothetical protein DFW101_2656 [Solidesulfovibrio carbinoliphilus subsp. oakridgensis]
MDAIGGSGAGQAAGALQQQTLGAQVVTGTIDKMNTDANGKVNPDHDFQTKVLAGMGIGKNLNTQA